MNSLAHSFFAATEGEAEAGEVAATLGAAATLGDVLAEAAVLAVAPAADGEAADGEAPAQPAAKNATLTNRATRQTDREPGLPIDTPSALVGRGRSADHSNALSSSRRGVVVWPRRASSSVPTDEDVDQ